MTEVIEIINLADNIKFLFKIYLINILKNNINFIIFWGIALKKSLKHNHIRSMILITQYWVL
jgi:hypothetical protein